MRCCARLHDVCIRIHTRIARRHKCVGACLRTHSVASPLALACVSLVDPEVARMITGKAREQLQRFGAAAVVMQDVG